MPYRVAVCDDDEEQLRYISCLLKEWGTARQCPVEIGKYRSAESFLFGYEEKPCDLLLLDIEMKGQSGMELARQLRAKKDRLPIVFSTGYSEYMPEGYEGEALHYMLKPLKKEKLFAV
ncbi:MAG: response regulator, partial [Lachnospiraceae bacterium]|nr:response regulator [Lachnospiraceae bacterium]